MYIIPQPAGELTGIRIGNWDVESAKIVILENLAQMRRKSNLRGGVRSVSKIMAETSTFNTVPRGSRFCENILIQPYLDKFICTTLFRMKVKNLLAIFMIITHSHSFFLMYNHHSHAEKNRYTANSPPITTLRIISLNTIIAILFLRLILRQKPL